MLRRPRLPDGFQGRAFKGNIWGEGCTPSDSDFYKFNSESKECNSWTFVGKGT